MIKAIIFDCFGVLVGTGFWDVYTSAGGDPFKDEIFINDMLGKVNSGVILHHEFDTAIAGKLGLSVEEYYAVSNRQEQANIPLFDYIKNELQPHYKIGLLTNATENTIAHRIPAKLREVFDVQIVSGDVGILKPDPRIFAMTIEQLGVQCAEAVYIDNLQQYLDPAARVGMKTLLYANFAEFKNQIEELLHANG